MFGALANILLVLAACASPEAASEHDDAASDDVEPIEFALVNTAESVLGCVQERTGLDAAYHERLAYSLTDEQLVPLYFSVALACRIREGEAIPEPIRVSFFEDVGILHSLARCLVEEQSWIESDDILDGVGGAVAPDVSAAEKTEALIACGFEDPASLSSDPFENG